MIGRLLHKSNAAARREVLARDHCFMTRGAANTLTEHYRDYFATPRQLEWYRLMAHDKAGNIVLLCNDVPHQTVLDIGSGDGAVLHRLDELAFGSKLYAVDISESGLKALQQKSWKRLVACKPFDRTEIPYADATFDLAVLSHVVEHLEHPRVLLREAARVARHVYVEVPLEYNHTNRRMKRVLDATGHINCYSPDLIRLLVQSCGLRVIRQEVRHFSKRAYAFHGSRRRLINYWIKELALRLAPRKAAAFFNYHCGLLCASSAHENSAHQD